MKRFAKFAIAIPFAWAIPVMADQSGQIHAQQALDYANRNCRPMAGTCYGAASEYREQRRMVADNAIFLCKDKYLEGHTGRNKQREANFLLCYKYLMGL